MGSSANRITASRLLASTRSAVAVVAVLLLGPAAADENKQSFTEGRLWRISKLGVDDSFVLGTIHVADPRVSVISKPIEDALARSHTLAMELASGGVVDAQVFELEEFDDGRRLEPLIGSEAFAQLRAELLAYEIPERVIERLKPWAAMMKIARAAPHGEERCLDQQILSAASARRMRVTSLEWAEEQIASFDTVPLDSQVALLKHTLAHRDALAATIEPTIDAWLRGDLEALAQISDRIGDQFPGMAYHYWQLTKHIIHNRTIVMHHRLFMPLRAGRVFVAVGAMHLYGDDGLLAMLKQDGYRVTKVW